MKVFISWSGNRSKFIAETLRQWLPKVIQAVNPWMSQEDIASGARWSSEIASELETSRVGIVCVTPENQHNPWIMFEAGALSKTISQTYVCPYLLGLNQSQMSGPLTQFQANLADKPGTKKLLATLNQALDENSLDKNQLDEIFEVWWPQLNESINQMPSFSDESHVRRTTDELLDEVVNNTREQLRREEVRIKNFEEQTMRFNDYLDTLGQQSRNQRALIDMISESMSQMPMMMNSNLLPEDSAELQSMFDQVKKITGLDQNIINQVKEINEFDQNVKQQLLKSDIEENSADNET